MQFENCSDFLPDRFVVTLPQLPESWGGLLGEPSWRLEWFNSEGIKQITNVSPTEAANLEIEIPVTLANPVTAWPFWPEFNLVPGHFRPAGALFPYDVSGNNIVLSWKAGVDAVFYKEIGDANRAADGTRHPAHFDWPRFRELFESDILNDAVIADPWLVDWHQEAERTAASGFDRRRLAPQPGEPLSIPVPASRWYGNSPFAAPLAFEGGIPEFNVRPGINVWICEEGILKIDGKTWVLQKY